MKNYFRTIQWIASLTAGSILVFQAVWVYRNYRTSEENFTIKVREALQKSVDQYLLEQIPTPVSLTGPAPSLSIISMVSREGAEDVSNNMKAPLKNTNPFKIAFHSLQIDTANLESVRLFVAQMTALSNKQKIEIPVVERYFRKELEREGITVVFRLSFEKRRLDETGRAISVSIGRSKGDWGIIAIPTGKGWHLLGKNMLPAVISLSLILLTAGCLWYMGFIIARQRRLDQTKNDFIDNLAHELRTPVAILKSTNEALLHFGQISDIEKTNRYLQFNANVLDKLEDGIDRLLRIRQYELGAKAASLAQVDIPALLEEVTRSFRENKRGIVSLSVALDKNILKSDAAMLKDIVANLVDNALKYCMSPATVRVSATSVSNGWQLEVDDDGIGISEEHLPLIFDKFFRVSSGDQHDVKGYGIGLSYVKQLVLQLGGDIRVHSELGIGTTFTITFQI